MLNKSVMQNVCCFENITSWENKVGYFFNFKNVNQICYAKGLNFYGFNFEITNCVKNCIEWHNTNCCCS